MFKGCVFMMIKETLKNIIQETNHHPFLFIGSGFSKRYMNTEKWDELLRYLCSLFTNNELQYSYYASTCSDMDYYGQQPHIAELLEKDFNKAVFTNDSFSDFRDKHMDELKANISPLKIAIAEHFSHVNLVPGNDKELSMLHKLSIRSIAGIITTNYDMLLEHFFPKFETYIGQEELLFANTTGIGEIYKIHGSVEYPSSIVISASDYKRFEDKSAYLIAKILTIFLEYPIIFLGYSINDRNIQNILETISQCLSQEKLNILKNRFIFVNYSDDNTINYINYGFKNGCSIPMMQVSTKDFLPIYEAIYDVKSTYNPSILRNLRQDIYKLAIEGEAHGNIIATGFERLDHLSPDANFIIGIGVTNNGHLIKTEQLYEDIVRDNQYLNPTLVIEEYLPELLKRNSGGLPMFKYLQTYKDEVFEAVKKQISIHNTVDSFLNDNLRKSKSNYRLTLSVKTVEEIIRLEGKDNAYKRLIFLEENDSINLHSMKEYISEILGDAPAKSLQNNTELKRLIRIYDFLKYKTTTT